MRFQALMPDVSSNPAFFGWIACDWHCIKCKDPPLVGHHQNWSYVEHEQVSFPAFMSTPQNLRSRFYIDNRALKHETRCDCGTRNPYPWTSTHSRWNDSCRQPCRDWCKDPWFAPPLILSSHFIICGSSTYFDVELLPNMRTAGYFTTGKAMSMDELANVKGRGWDDVDH